MSEVLQFPRIRLQEFHECRLRRPVKGAMVDEQSDSLLTEPLAPTMERWLAANDHFVLSQAVSHSHAVLGGGAGLITVCYFLMTVAKSDAVLMQYGT